MGARPRGTCASCGNPTWRRSVTRCQACYLKAVQPDATVEADLQTVRVKRDTSDLKKRYAEALKTIERQQAQLDAAAHLKERPQTLTIEPTKASKTSEATAVWVASDWHIEETVGPEVGDLNRYDLTIAESRAMQFFRNGLRLTHILGQDVTISTVLLPLLGDFISGDIHDELVEVNSLTPVEAIVKAQSLIISGLEFALKHSDYRFVLPCHSGNHARTTKTTRFGTEHGHSLEHLMYLHLATHFRHEPRVTFLIPDGPHSYVTVYDQVLRFQHGHMIKYGGGVGGIYIPVNKAIAQWNRAKHADLDVFGHFHQAVDGGNFICNGSLIGYSSFALSIKASYEKPKQAMFLLDKKRGRTFNCPILFDC